MSEGESRKLTGEERAELARLVETIDFQPSMPRTLVLTAIFFAGYWMGSSVFPRFVRTALLLIMVLASSIVWYGYVKSARLRKRFAADAEHGQLTTATHLDKDENGAETTTEVEVLQHSGWAWTVAGEPAPWRTDPKGFF